MDPVGAWTTIVVAIAVLVLASFPLRARLHPRVVDAMLAIGGAGIGVGGLLFLRDVEPSSWVVTPALLAIATVAHVRFLFAGEGPFRT